MNSLVADTTPLKTMDRLDGPEGSTSGLESCPILVVEDDSSLRALLSEALDLHGYRVESVLDCREAKARLMSGLYSFILLDVVLPGVSGISFYYDLKGIWPELAPRVIFMTGAIERDPHLGVLRQEGRPVLLKPIRIQELMAVLWALDQG